MARFPVSLLITAAFLYPARRAFPSETQPAQAKADRVLVLKKERKLILLSGEKELKTYRISLGGDAVGPKQREGDHKTPEGTYVLDRRNPHSKFYRSIHISLSESERSQARSTARRAPRWRHFRSWPAQRIRLGQQIAHCPGLDRRLYCCNRRR